MATKKATEKATEKATKKESPVLVIKGNLKRCAYEGGYIPTKTGKRKLEDKWRLYITNIKSPELDSLVADMYDSNDKYSPKASKVLAEKGTINELNLSTIFELPTMIEGRYDDVENVVGGDDVPCSIKVVLKDTTIYPIALVVEKNGIESNPFEGM